MASAQDPLLSSNQADGTYGIVGIQRPVGAKSETERIPFSRNIPARINIADFYLPPPDLPKPGDKPPPTGGTTDLVWTEIKEKQWTLYVYALIKFKNRPIEDKLSYFQIASIHGYPETPWDGCDPPNADPPEGVQLPPGMNPFGGYCEHNTLAFPTWHRPYMLLFEQRVYEEMCEVIESWIKEKRFDKLPKDEVEKWQEAADQWRLPYWDWARKQSYNKKLSVPKVLTLQKVKVRLPDEDYKYEWNPLWEFENPLKGPDNEPLTFGDVDMLQWRIRPDFSDGSIGDKSQRYALDNRIRWDLTARTGRYGIFLNQKKTKYIGLEGINNILSANLHINDFTMNIQGPNTGGTLSDAVSRLFSKDYSPHWGTFASTKWRNEHKKTMGADPTTFISLESVHNQVHNVAGGVEYSTGMGHMSDVPVAAFDPLFWLHHCNIDRITAIWQVLHWNNWWDTKEPDPDKPDPGDPEIPNIKDVMPDDPLKPFHIKSNGNPKGDFWTSNMCRDWTKLYYQYDDLVPDPRLIDESGKLKEDEYIAVIQNNMEELYPSTGRAAADIFDSKKHDKLPKEVMESLGDDFGVDQTTWNDYVINVIYDRYALNGRSYTIKFYLGGNHNAPDSEQLDNHLIGRVYTFSANTAVEGKPGCANCTVQQEAGILSKAQIPITIRLLRDLLDKDIEFWNMGKERVTSYLKDNLHWKYIAYGGAELPAKRFNKTSISVAHGEGRHTVIEYLPTGSLASKEGPKRTRVPEYNYGSYDYLFDVTKDKVGGAKE